MAAGIHTRPGSALERAFSRNLYATAGDFTFSIRPPERDGSWMDDVRIDLNRPRVRGWILGASVAVPPLVCWLLSLAGSAVATTTAVLVLVLPVVAAAATGSRVAGIAAALAATAGFDFFLTEPVHTFTITDPDDLETAILLLLVGAAVGELAIWGRRQQARASREQGYLDGLLGTASAVAAGAASGEEVVDLVRTQLVTLLRVDGVRFDPATRFGLPSLGEDGTLVRAGHPVDVTRKGLPTDTQVTLPVRHGGTVYGHFLLTAATRVVRPSRNQLRVAAMLADQAGAALATDARAG
jgi:K+-sensing histidine kinase KdpD